MSAKCWIRYRLGSLLRLAGKTEGAIRQFQAALQGCPDHLSARADLAWALAHVGRYEEAIHHYQRLVVQVPHWVQPHLGLGEAFQRLGRHNKAIAAYSAAIERSKSNTLAHYNIAESYIATGDLQSALLAYRRVVSMQPDDAEAVGNLGATLGRLGHWQEAVEVNRKAMVLKPSATHAYNLGVALAEVNDFALAERAFREALAFDRHSTDLKVRLAQAVSDQGRLDEALRIVDDALAQDPRDGQALVVKSGLLLARHRLQEAIDTARLAVTTHPDMPEARAALGWALLKAGQPEDALAVIEAARGLISRVDYLAGRGAALSALGRHGEALTIFDDIVRSTPEYFQDRDEIAEYVQRSRSALNGDGRSRDTHR